MIDVTQADVNAFLLKLITIGCIGSWIIVVGILAVGSVIDKTAEERYESRQWLAGILLVTAICIAFIWYLQLPATRGAQ